IAGSAKSVSCVPSRYSLGEPGMPCSRYTTGYREDCVKPGGRYTYPGRTVPGNVPRRTIPPAGPDDTGVKPASTIDASTEAAESTPRRYGRDVKISFAHS